MRGPCLKPLSLMNPLMAGLALAAALWSTAVQAALPIEHWTTSRGTRVLFVRADAIPMLDVSIAFDAGSRYDPPGRKGLAGWVVGMLARGSDGLDEAAIAELEADLGAIRGGSADDDRATVSMRMLASDKERTASIDLLARLVSRPTFPQAQLERERQRSLQSFRESLTKPEVIASRAFYPKVFGPHPYGAVGSEEDLQAINRDELVRFHQARFGAANAVISMVGAISREQAQAIAEQLVKDLPQGSAAPALPKSFRPGPASSGSRTRPRRAIFWWAPRPSREAIRISSRCSSATIFWAEAVLSRV